MNQDNFPSPRADAESLVDLLRRHTALCPSVVSTKWKPIKYCFKTCWKHLPPTNQPLESPNKKEKQHPTSPMSHLCSNYTATLFCNLHSGEKILEYIILFYPKSTNSFFLTLLGFGIIVFTGIIVLQNGEIRRFVTNDFQVGFLFYF